MLDLGKLTVEMNREAQNPTGERLPEIWHQLENHEGKMIMDEPVRCAQCGMMLNDKERKNPHKYENSIICNQCYYELCTVCDFYPPYYGLE